ncbi:cysteine protease family C01A [Achlya hypogyna]|uniref:Cysteine protease family C01A n=1 Tax=Achlya hypogyna TaxID=1202772 RepID=A0A1V9YDB7_ACHHY|nr:cysteine protease family C01A [Achlya hypogyna]
MELENWKRSAAGKAAVENGLIPSPPKTESTDKENFMLLRFAETKKVVARLNQANPHATFSEKNPFALMTAAEFATFASGLSNTTSSSERQHRGARELTLAQTQAGNIDWSTDKCMSSVRNQGSCGSCWAFATVGAVEFAQCKATGSLNSFSEQQLVSCATSAGHGCQGGWPTKALDYVAQTGLCSATAYPYTSGSTQQTGPCQNCEKQKLSVGGSVTVQGEGALQAALDNQVVVVTVEAGNDVWRNYQSGVVTHCPGAASDHAVIAVGYGIENDLNYFKVKNSWGGSWGDNGYMKLQRGVGGKGMCNIAAQGSYPKSTAVYPQADV